MNKITFLGAGSTVFVKNVLGDVMMTEALQDFELALFDIDAERLSDSERLLTSLAHSLGSRCVVNVYHDRKKRYAGPNMSSTPSRSVDMIHAPLQTSRFRRNTDCVKRLQIHSVSAEFSVTCGRFRSCWISPEICRKYVQMRGS